MRGDGLFKSGAAEVLEGIAGSAGYAIGRALIVDTRRSGVVRRHVTPDAVAAELAHFDEAVARAASELRVVLAAKQGTASRAESSILEAYVLMVEDETLRAAVEGKIQSTNICAEWALDLAVGEMAAQLRQSGDPYLAERSHDFEFVEDRLLRTMAGKHGAVVLPKDGAPGVLVAHDLSPAETAGLTKERVLAIVTEVGTRTSHTAILARALEIPAVVGVPNLLSRVGSGDLIVVDGVHGQVAITPSEALIADTHARAGRFSDVARHRREARDRPIRTKCGVTVELRANIELPSEAEVALEQGARGIGLYRTEFLYLDRTEPPSEDEQYETYRRVVETLAPLPVTLRTFDIGGDKFASVFQVPAEMNPALGLRAVRLGLARPDIFLTQLRAMVRASVHGKMRIMVPMIASLGELREVRRLFDRAIVDVDAAGQPRSLEIPLGMMVEVPSAAVMADEFAAETEFMSIGTNDLVQYTLAVDRSSPELAYLASFFDPAILRLVRMVIKGGANHQRPVFVCGAMASDPLAAILLVGMGLRELSMESAAIPEIREVIGQVTVAEAEEAAQAAFTGETALDIERMLLERFGERLEVGE
ncbi:MAG TPA: phosphoenolpyruvate--protein phosphotransferase [Polyangiaceae bacterium]|jgi:phosphotransferase system enzyme I (PtsI)|nr:phosphoenolpyruvate--protein phosphotransferase [Polyangiaceae bacterium]